MKRSRLYLQRDDESHTEALIRFGSEEFAFQLLSGRHGASRSQPPHGERMADSSVLGPFGDRRGNRGSVRPASAFGEGVAARNTYPAGWCQVVWLRPSFLRKSPADRRTSLGETIPRLGPLRLAWLRRRPQIDKIAMVPAPGPANPLGITDASAPASTPPAAPVFAQPTPPPTPQPPMAAPGLATRGSAVGPAGMATAPNDPAAAYAQLMSMIQPKPPVPMAGEGGTGPACRKPLSR